MLHHARIFKGMQQNIGRKLGVQVTRSELAAGAESSILIFEGLLKKWRVDVKKEIVLGKQIGEGSSGVVYEGFFRNTGTAAGTESVSGSSQSSRVAVKLIKSTHRLQFRREVLALAATEAKMEKNSLLLVPLVGAVMCGGSGGRAGLHVDGEEDGRWSSSDYKYAVITKYMEGGSLHEYLRRETHLDIVRVMDLAIGITEGVAFLHSRGLVHM